MESLNGLDDVVWNPATDTSWRNVRRASLSRRPSTKWRCKSAWGLTSDANVPLVGDGHAPGRAKGDGDRRACDPPPY
jgi:glycogen synthase